jgi:outer membrane protein assembly factor BamE (lipoprotein component of BamABCDE complex)
MIWASNLETDMSKQRSPRLVMAMGAILLMAGCTVPTRPDTAPEERLTVGTAQREIRLGMSGSEVAGSMGSPNIVSTDPERNEVWIYDRISTEYVRADQSAGALLIGVGGSAGGAVGGRASKSKATRTQRTLTVIVWFDDGGQVRDFSYHTSRF